MSLVKRKESRSFDFFFFLNVFCVFFWCLEDRKTCKKTMQRAKIRKNMIPQVQRVPRTFYSPSKNFKAAAHVGPPASNLLWLSWSWHVWKGLDFLFLRRYGSWNSNGQIKSYSSWKLVVHRSVHYPRFCDISTVLTPILTYDE